MHNRVLVEVDLALIGLLQAVASPNVDLVAGVLNYAAAAEVTLAAMGGLAFWRWWRGSPLLGASAPLLFLVSVPIELALKFTVDQPVPREFYRESIRYALIGLPTMQSYPSGWAIRAAFLSLVLSYLFRWHPAATVTLATLALVGGACRAYLGHHWPMDVVGGLAFGAGLGCFAIWLMKTKRAPAEASAR